MISRYTSSYSIRDLLVARRCGPGLETLLPPGLPTSAAGAFWLATATDAMLLALIVDIPKGKVMVSAYTCNKVPVALEAAGYEPVFLDIDPATGLTPAEALDRFRPGDLTALIATHMFGVCCDLRGYRAQADRLGVPLIEDCAGAFGASQDGILAGSTGDFALFSFGRGKTLNLGGGGLLTVRTEATAERIAAHWSDIVVGLRRSGPGLARQLIHSAPVWDLLMPAALRFKRLLKGTWLWEQEAPPTYPERSGSPSPQSGLAHLSLARQLDIETTLRHRRELEATYMAVIQNRSAVRTLTLPQGVPQPLRPSYPVLVCNQASAFRFMHQRGIDCGLSFSYSAGSLRGGEHPGSETVAARIITLPLHEGVSPATARCIAETLNAWQPRSAD